MDGIFIFFEMEKTGEVKVCGEQILLLEIKASSEVGRWGQVDLSREVSAWDVIWSRQIDVLFYKFIV